jgi:hypothetical protein
VLPHLSGLLTALCPATNAVHDEGIMPKRIVVVSEDGDFLDN